MSRPGRSARRRRGRGLHAATEPAGGSSETSGAVPTPTPATPAPADPEPVTEEPVTVELVTEELVTEEPASAEPLAEAPSTEESGAEASATEKSGTEAERTLTAVGAPAAAGATVAGATVAATAAAEAGDTPRSPHRRLLRTMIVLVVLLVGAAVAIPFAYHDRSHGGSTAAAASNRKSGDGRHATDPPRPPETVTSFDPASGTTAVAPDTSIEVTFSIPLALGSPLPTLSPAVAGTWRIVGSSEMEFTPSASFIPSTKYTVTVPGGPTGVLARDGSELDQPVVSTFTVAAGNVVRLQQLLAKLGYLPVSFTGTTPVPAGMALAQPGSFVWRYSGFPSAYTSQWSPTQFTALTRGAVMAFETQNGLEVDGTAGPQVWSALLAAAAANKKDAEPLTYVVVTKNLPEHLTVWVNGALTFSDVPCNTGVAGAPTTDGTFEVFEHVQTSNMTGTDVTGTSYDVTVPWASYFDGGEALHGYPRASYGFPQSNGCVEMTIGTAAKVWPYTPIGTIVTVLGPTA